MNTKTGLAPKSFRSSFAKFMAICLLLAGIYRVIQDPTGSAEAINAAWSSLTTFGSDLHIGGGGS